MDFVEALEGATLVGVSLIAIITAVVQAIKNRFGLEGDQAKWLAVGIGTLLGSAYLLAAFPLADWSFPALLSPLGLRLGAAFAWSFLSPLGYDLLKGTAKKGVEEQLDEESVIIAVVENE